MYILKDNGKEVFRAENYDDCLMRLHKIQSQSSDRAMKYGGYTIEHTAHTRYNDKLQPCDEVTEEFFEDQLEVLPPEETYRVDKKMVAFLVGEAHHHKDGIEQFSCFCRHEGKHYWLGYCGVKDLEKQYKKALLVFNSSTT